MGGFINQSLNIDCRQSLFDQLLEFLVKCSTLMVSNTINKLENDEEKITAHLIENYLNNISVRNSLLQKSLPLKFSNEISENYDPVTNTYVGRVDIKAGSANWFSCENNNDYYTIECKRIDGTSQLNKKYVIQGVARFVIPPVKYPSFHNKNIMFGYIVKDINIYHNITKIDLVHKKELSKYITKDIQCVSNTSNSSFCICESEYTVESKPLLLKHIFYDLSDIIS